MVDLLKVATKLFGSYLKPNGLVASLSSFFKHEENNLSQTIAKFF